MGYEAPWAWTFFFLTAALVFSSFFLEGKVLLASSIIRSVIIRTSCSDIACRGRETSDCGTR